MRRIDQVLGGPLFRVDDLACSLAAAAIRSYKADIEDTAWADLPQGEQLAFKLAFISICHNFNWDFMQSTLAQHLLDANYGNVVDLLVNIDARILSAWLINYSKPERIRAKERAALLRDTGRQLKDKYGGDAAKLINESDHRIAGEEGFRARLDVFQAFGTDPLRKKSNVLIHDLVREGLVRFVDEENIEPAVDYHIMRLYLRTGRVVPTSAEVMQELKGRPNPRPRLVRLLREAVSIALKQTAFYAGLSVPDVNYVEWQLGRAVCVRECPVCQSGCDGAGVADDIKKLYSGLCPYIGFCEAYSHKEWLTLKEPAFKTSFY